MDAPLHPELFRTYQSLSISRGDYTADIQITSVGHLIKWRYAGLTLTEVATAANHPLPEQRRLMSYRLVGKKSDSINCRGGIKYRMKIASEQVQPDLFWNYQKMLTQEATQNGMLEQFDSSGRFALGAVSYINFDMRDRLLSFKTFHTFPDDYVIVSSQSWFELP